MPEATKSIPLALPRVLLTLKRSGDHWAYATHQKFAHKWTEYIEATRGVKTGYHSLPERKGIRKATGSRLRG